MGTYCVRNILVCMCGTYFIKTLLVCIHGEDTVLEISWYVYVVFFLGLHHVYTICQTYTGMYVGHNCVRTSLYMCPPPPPGFIMPKYILATK